MTLTNNSRMSGPPLLARIDYSALAEPGTNEAEAQPISLRSTSRGHRVHLTKASLLAAQDLTGNVPTTFDTVDADTDGFYSSGATTRITIPAHLNGARVDVEAFVTITALTANLRVRIFLNHFNSSDALQSKRVTDNTDPDVFVADAVSMLDVEVATGDYFTTTLQTTTDTSVDIGADAVFTLRVVHRVDDAKDWTYSVTAEDSGTAGILDGEPGLIYSGPSGNYVRVSVDGFDTLEHASTPPEASDKAALVLYRNSTPAGFSDEGFTTHAAETAVENNLDVEVGPLNEGDVLRAGVAFTGEEADADLIITPGELTIT